MSKIPIWIDTDTGVDDLFAILCALQLENAEVVGVSSVMGNVPHHYTFPNARNTLAFAGREDIPVYPGAEVPMVVRHVSAEHIHGPQGLGDAVLEESSAPKETKLAWDAMYEAAKEHEGFEIVALGPLTNVATMIVAHPDSVNYIKRIVIMGGAAQGGNITASAEFNIYDDPHAAEAVMKSGVPVVMFGLDITMTTYLSHEDLEEINAMGKVGKLFEETMVYAIKDNSERIGEKAVAIHDVCPIIYYDYPDIFEGVPCGIRVETQGKFTFGKTVVDIWSDAKFPEKNGFVILDGNREELARVFKEMLKSYQ